MLERVVRTAAGEDPKMARLVSYWSVTVLLYVLCLGIVWLEVFTGTGKRLPALGITLLSIMGHAGFYLIIRNSRRLRFTPVQLAVHQGRFAVLITCLGYPIVGPFRGACLVVLLVTLVFCAFTLEARKTHALSVFAIALLGGMMMVMSRIDAAFDTRIEFVHFVLIGTMVAVVGILTGRMSDLRARLQKQKNELLVALAKIQDLATHDALTRLPNRRFMVDLLQGGDRDGDGQPSCLALLDIDWFKRVNDTYGHAAGDQVLQRFAEEGSKLLRPTDILARWGGEEFLLFLPRTTLEQAHGIVERFRERTQGWAFGDGDTPVRVTISAGVVELHDREEYGSGISRADALLYQAKSAGRNRVIAEASRPAAATR